MEEMASLWCYQETLDEMRQKLLYTNLELDQLKAERIDEMRKNREYVKQLIQFLKIVCQERDEARDQLEKLMNKLDSNNNYSTKTNSDITDQSNSLSETYNPKIDSFFNAASSSSNNMADSYSLAYTNQANEFAVNYVPQLALNVDQASLVIDKLVKGKTLPQQGKLLQTVIETGPLLQTLLVTGQLPQWQNPPSFNISIKGCSESDILNQNLGSRSILLNCQPYYSSSTTSMLNFASVSCLENHSAGADLNSFVLGKRQRLN